MLNWIVATEEQYQAVNITLSPYARRFVIGTPSGDMEFIIEHVDNQSDKFEEIVHLLPVDCFMSDTTLQMILPVEVDNGLTNV